MRNLLYGMMLGSGLLLSGCAATSSGEGRSAGHGPQSQSCFWPSSVSGFTDAGVDRLHVHTGPKDVYLFEMMSPCHDLQYTEDLALETRSGGMICSGLDVTLIVPSSIGPRRCHVRMIRKLTEEEMKAR